MNGLTPEDRHARKAALIAGIAAGKTVIEAATESGIGWRRAYVWRAEDPAFRAAWDRARAQIKARAPAELVVPPSPEPPAPLPGFAVPPSPPLPPLRTRGRAGKPPITVIIEPFDKYHAAKAEAAKPGDGSRAAAAADDPRWGADDGAY